MTRPVRHVLDVTPDLVHNNDDRPAPDRIAVRVGCDTCRTGRFWRLPVGRWSIAHIHGAGTWTAHLQRMNPAAPSHRNRPMAAGPTAPKGSHR